MTDKPDENIPPDEDPTPVDEAARVDDEPDLGDEGDTFAEPGLVVEDDQEIALDDVPVDEEPDVLDDEDSDAVDEDSDVVDEDLDVVDDEDSDVVIDEDVDVADHEVEPVVDDEPEPVVDDEPEPVVDDEPDEDESDDTIMAAPLEGETAADDAGDDSTDLPATDTDGDEPSRHWGRRLTLGLVVVVGVLYVGGYFLTGSRMPANATIGGVDVGGKSPGAARDAVDKALTPRVDQEITLAYGKKEFGIKPKDAGLALDLDRSISEAGGERSWNPADMIGLFAGDHDNDPALDVDDTLLQSAIGTIGETVDKDVVEAQITFPKGKPAPRQPKAGRVVARADAATAIREAYLVNDKPIEVPTEVVEPAVDSAGLADAVKKIAEPAVSGPVTIRVGDKTVELPVTAYAPALVVRVVDGELKPRLDPKKLAGPLTDSTTGIGKKAVDATVRIRDNKAVVVPGKEGVGLQPKEMATKLIPALSRTGSERSVEVEAKLVEPLFTTKDAKALRIKEKISEFETEFPYAEYRNTNQGRAAELINGTILKPGQTFSFNNTVGERTAANGFVNGTVINGGVFREELGGGVSQVATTTYNAGFFGAMDDVEHHPHAFYINRYPVGREATVYFGSLDLRFKNSTKYGVLIRSYVVKSTPSSAGIMHVELWSTKVYDVKAGASPRRNGRSPGTQYDDTDRCVPQDPIGGFDIDIYRTFYQGGKKVKTETDTANYQAADHVICGKKPD